MNTTSGLLQDTQAFWNRNPCDGQSDVFALMRFRYKKEPWLPGVIERVAQFRSVLEVGCGQGTDALRCCEWMDADSTYTAVDYSDQSVQSARRNGREYRDRLTVTPTFDTGNAESLQFPDNTFDCVLSIGVLHHTPDTQKAVREVHRVLKPGGTAFVALYRKLSPKVLAARGLRLMSRGVDRIAGRQGCLYEGLRRFGSDHRLGTMLLECFGVPIMSSYSARKMRVLFEPFETQRIRPVGVEIPFGLGTSWDRKGNPFGTMWLAEARKSPQ